MSDKPEPRLDPVAKHQEDFVAGRSKGHAAATLRAKATISYIKEHPGVDSLTLQSALNHQANVQLLIKHKLVILRRKIVEGKQITQAHGAAGGENQPKTP